MLVGTARRWVERLVSVMVWIGAVEGLIAMLEAAAGFQLMPLVMARLPLAKLFISVSLGDTMTGQMVRAGLPRVKATFHQAIDLGWFLGIVLIVMIGCWDIWGRGWQLPLKLLVLACVAGGLLATVSGTPILATTCGLLVLLMFLPGRRRWRTLLSGVMLLALVGVLVAGVPSLSTYRDAVAAYFGARNYVWQHGGVGPNREYRLSTYGRVWPLIEESPVLGHGDMLQRTDVMSRTRDLASRYLAVLIEGGAVGLIAAFLPAVWGIVTALRTRRRARDPGLRALSGVYVAVLVQCLLMNGVKNYGGINDTFFWVFVGLACAAPALVLQKPTQAAALRCQRQEGDSLVTGRQWV